MDLDFHLKSNEGHTCNQTRKSFRNSKKNNLFLKNPALLRSILQTRKNTWLFLIKFADQISFFIKTVSSQVSEMISARVDFFFYCWVQPTFKCLLNLDNKKYDKNHINVNHIRMQLYKVILLNFLIYIEVIIERKFYICGCSMRKKKRPRIHVA